MDQLDIDQWSMFEDLTSGLSSGSSWADINQDGETDGTDELLIEGDFGRCPKKSPAQVGG